MTVGLFKKIIGYDYSDVTAINMRSISDTYKLTNTDSHIIREGDKYLNFILREIENIAKSGNNSLTLWNWTLGEDIYSELVSRGFQLKDIKATYSYTDEKTDVTHVCSGIKITW